MSNSKFEFELQTGSQLSSFDSNSKSKWLRVSLNLTLS